MTAVSVVETPGFRSSVITPEHHSGMHTFGDIGQKVKGTFPIHKEILWVALLAPNDIDA